MSVSAHGDAAMESGNEVTIKEAFPLKRLGRTKKLFAFLRVVQHELFDEASRVELKRCIARQGLATLQAAPNPAGAAGGARAPFLKSVSGFNQGAFWNQTADDEDYWPPAAEPRLADSVGSSMRHQPASF